MKEASGELSMTLIVIVAAGAILLIFYAFRQPIFDMINRMWNGFESKSKDNWTPSGVIIPGYTIELNK